MLDNYLQNYRDPFAGATERTFAINQNAQQQTLFAQQQADYAQKQAQEQYKIDRMLALNKEISDLGYTQAADGSRTYTKPLPDDYIRLMQKYPEIKADYSDLYNVSNANKAKQEIEQLQNIHAALDSGDYLLALQKTEQYAQQSLRAGDKIGADRLMEIGKVIERNPAAAEKSLMSGIVLLGNQSYPANYALLHKLPAERAQIAQANATAEQNRALAERKQTQEEQIAARELTRKEAETGASINKTQQESNKIATETGDIGRTLDPAVSKVVTDFTTSATKNADESLQLSTVAQQLAGVKMKAGVWAYLDETLKQFWGGQDSRTYLRNEVERLKQGLVLGSLPPGSASDKDISTVQKGFPDTNANQKTVQMFLESLSRVKQALADRDNAKAVFYEHNTALTPLRRGFVVANHYYSPGTTFQSFQETYRPDVGSLLPTTADVLPKK